MVARLYQYQFGARRGLILERNGCLGEIAPLEGFSKETFAEAREETLSLLSSPTPQPRLPSVQFGFASATALLSPLSIPLCALHRPLPSCPTLKLKIGGISVPAAIALVNTYCKTHRLRIDCNRKWNLQQALQFASHFSPSDFEYCEEPVFPFRDLVRFSEETRFSIAADESLRDSPYWEIPTLAALIIKPTLMGSSLPRNDRAVPFVFSSCYESSLGLLHIARLAALYSPNIAHGLDTFCDDLLMPPLSAEGGRLVWRKSSHPVDVSKLSLIAEEKKIGSIMRE